MPEYTNTNDDAVEPINTTDSAAEQDDATQVVVTSETVTGSLADDIPENAEQEQELEQFERRIDEILATGQLDETLRVTDTQGIAQVLPVLDSEPISHLLNGIEEIGGRANVFVHTADGIAVLNVAEYTPDDSGLENADDTPTGETPVVSETVVEEKEAE